jgi:hypothetical protein
MKTYTEQARQAGAIADLWVGHPSNELAGEERVMTPRVPRTDVSDRHHRTARRTWSH